MDEQVFRLIALLLLLLAFGIVWGTNLLRVGVSRDVVYSRQESLSFALFSRGLALLSLAGLVVCVDDPHSMAWSRIDAPTWLRLLGVPVAVAGVVLLSWVLSSLGRNFSMSLTTEHHTLVTDGPYRWVRHPMYTAFLTVFAGLFLVTANWFIGLTGISVYATAMVVRTPREERLLIAAFGQQYVSYRERTGRFLPKASRLARRSG